MALKHFIKKLLSGFQVIFKPVHANNKPIHLQVEPINDCNLNCISCSRARNIRETTSMSFVNFKKIINNVGPLSLILSGSGEPLLNPEIFKMIAYCRSNNIAVDLTTNGTLLLKHAEQLIDSMPNMLSISLDASTPDTYKKIRQCDSFDNIIAGINKLQELKSVSNLSEPVIRLQFVIQRLNITELKSFILLTKKLNVSYALFQPLSLVGVEDRTSLLADGLTQEIILSEIKSAYGFARQNGITTNLDLIIRDFALFWNRYANTRIKMSKRVCANPWFDAYITADGMFQPCCSFAGVQSGIYFGNVFNNNFSDLFNSSEFLNFRKKIKAGERPYSVCQSCVPLKISDLVLKDMLHSTKKLFIKKHS